MIPIRSKYENWYGSTFGFSYNTFCLPIFIYLYINTVYISHDSMRYFHCPCTIISFISHNKFLIWDLLLRRFLFLSNIYAMPGAARARMDDTVSRSSYNRIRSIICWLFVPLNGGWIIFSSRLPTYIMLCHLLRNENANVERIACTQNNYKCEPKQTH